VVHFQQHNAVSCSVLSAEIIQPHICCFTSSMSYVIFKSAWFFCYQIGLNSRCIIKRFIKNQSLGSPVACCLEKCRTARSHPLPFIHLAVCLTKGPKPLQKRALHIVRSRAFSFRCEYPLLSLKSSSSFLRPLSRLPVTFILPLSFLQ
jgi:hypothetical protein